MNAQPQRPQRTIRVQNDENNDPTTKQSLHQRHKSTGALANMLGAGGLKAAAKRTAFGDVSNTVKSLITHQDDSAVNGKHVPQDCVKPLQLQDKSALLRPAQRPLSSIVNNAPKSGLSSAPAASKIALTQAKEQAPGHKRAQSKKSTAVYIDPSTEHVQAQASTNEQVAVDPVHQGPRPSKSQPQSKQNQQSLRRTQSKLLPNIASEQAELAAVSEQSCVPVNEQVANPEAYESYLSNIIQNDVVGNEDEAASHDAIDEQHRQLSSFPSTREPEEYWDDEEDETYDEQGYTTAHSYRSRGDNTTGGAITVMIPVVNQKAKREIAAAAQMVTEAKTLEEIEDEAWDTSMVAEYGDEIFEYMRQLEVSMSPNPHYMDMQTEIQWSMRSVLMDWLIQVHHRFGLLPETLFLCVNYIDRFLSHKIVSLGKLQLVGATAIFVAAKYEEINCPSVNEIVYMVDGGYNVDEILKAERFMLSMLQFELGWPGPMSFLRRISKADDYDLETRTLAKYFLEVTIMDERFVGTPPSYIAAGAHCFARMMLKKGDWSQYHVYYSGYTWTQLRPLVCMLMECCEAPQKHHGAVFEKYSDRKYKRASLFTQGEMTKGFRLPPTHVARPSLPSLEDVAAHMPYNTGRDSFTRAVPIKG